VREWTVAAAVIKSPDGDSVLLVQNRRRDGSLDWSPPAGVVDEGETVLEALTREVREETGLVVDAWVGPLWTTEVTAPGLGFHLRVEAHLAAEVTGEVTIDDPDGIVVDAVWVDCAGCHTPLRTSWVPTHEPFLEWLAEPWTDTRAFAYQLEGADRATGVITRL
jgi:8-oxo-dGTP diphosphatase